MHDSQDGNVLNSKDWSFIKGENISPPKSLAPSYLELQKTEDRESAELRERGMNQHLVYYKDAAGYIDFVPQAIDTKVMNDDTITQMKRR